MKILQIAGSGAVGTAKAGPVSSTIAHLANAFSAAGHDVHVADTPAVDHRCTLLSSVEVHELLPRRGGARQPLSKLLGSIMSARADFDALKEHIAAADYQFIHVHDGGQALVGGLLHRDRVIWTHHGMNWTMESVHRNRRRGPRARFERWLDSAARRAARHIVVLNSQTRAALHGKNVSMIPNGIDLRAWPVIDRCEARRFLDIPQTDFLLTYVGRVAPVKGVDVYVRAIEMAARHIALKADAIGSLSGEFGESDRISPYAEAVRSMGSTTVFRGFIHRDEPEYRMRLAAADLVIIPSLTEPFGLVVLEALACGARIIGSDVGGIRDMLAGGRGVLVPAGDSDALACAIVEHHARLQKGEAARTDHIDLRSYQWERIAERYAALMTSLLPGRGSA